MICRNKYEKNGNYLYAGSPVDSEENDPALILGA